MPAKKTGAKPVNDFQEMVRARLREATRGKIDALAKFLRVPDRSVLYKRFTHGGPALCLDFLDELHTFLQTSVSEMCSVPGALWQEVKPPEAQLLIYFRQLTYTQQLGLLAVLEGRLAQPPKARRARWGHAELSAEQQLLVDLYAQSEQQQREGVMKILQGAAEKAAREQHHSNDTNE